MGGDGSQPYSYLLRTPANDFIITERTGSLGINRGGGRNACARTSPNSQAIICGDPVSLMEADIISNTIRDFITGFFISPPTTVRPRQVRHHAAARSQELTWRQPNKRRKSYTVLAGLR